MNLYIRMMTDAIEEIERSLADPPSLRSLSARFFLSEFHFSRLFRVITGTGFRQYILGRRLTQAGESLREKSISVTEVAYDFGFSSPEVFSRAFRKRFGLSPASYRKGDFEISPTARACVTERDIVNYRGTLTLKGDFIYLEPMTLTGLSVEVDEHRVDFEATLKFAGELLATASGSGIFYAVVNCHGDESGMYTVFFGEQVPAVIGDVQRVTRQIPPGWYARFSYHGNILDMRSTFNDDLYRWMIVREVEPSGCGIGMIDIFNREDMENITILIPVKEPK